MKHKSSNSIVVASRATLAAALMLAGLSSPLYADSAVQSQTINLTAGQSFTIDHLKKGSPPALHVIENPHALVINGDKSGQLLLLGAERGKWEVTVIRDDGATVAYQVNVAAIANSKNPLTAGVAPVASSDNPPMPATSVVNTDAFSETVRPSDVDAYSFDAFGPTANAPAPASNAPAPGQSPSQPAPQVRATANQRDLGVTAPTVDGYRDNPAVAAEGGYESPSVSTGANYMPADGISLMAGTSQIVDFTRRLKRISIADSTIADIQVISPYQLNLIGHKPGFTTLVVWDDQGRYQERQVRIDTGSKQQVMLNVIVAELDRTKIEQQGIDLSVALANSGVSLASLPGSVASPYSATSALSAGTGSVAGVAPTGGQLIPLLLSSTMTYGLTTLGSGIATQTLFQFLESHSLGRILAQPHLLANSGQTASFLSGGEIPIVLAQALNTSIVFKQFGTSVNFLPTVVGSKDIELLVKTEVSQPDYAHGVSLFGFTVPSFVTRKADTLVRLDDGQTLIIAGLILHNRTSAVHKVPYLGDIPYAGALFRNTIWQDSDTDLVMAVMPQIVRPLPSGGQVFEPSSGAPLTEQEIRTKRLATPDASRPRF